MKHLYCIAILFHTTCIYSAPSGTCDVHLKPVWHVLQHTSEKNITFKGNWVHAGTITFRKKLLGPITLHTIIFNWHGPTIDTLDAALYYSDLNKPFLAIDQHWIADSRWNPQTQKLIFKFTHPYTLCAITTFHLVLTVPQTLEAVLKKGFFTLASCSLPDAYKNVAKEQRKLCFNAVTNNTKA